MCYETLCERPSFALSKMAFCRVKGGLLRRVLPSFAVQSAFGTVFAIHIHS